MAVIGYARISTVEQNIEPQIEMLKTAGCEKIFSEQRSGVDAQRPELEKMVDYSREGDTVVCTKLDRIGRSTRDVLDTVNSLQSKGVAFRCLNINLDTSTSTGKLMLTMLAGIATFERELMLERQREGIRSAKEAGKYQGRKPTARAKANEVMAMISDGMTKQAIATALGIGIASVYRIAKTAR